MNKIILILLMGLGLFSTTACQSLPTTPLERPVLTGDIGDFERPSTESTGDPYIDSVGKFGGLQDSLSVAPKVEISWLARPASSSNPEVRRIPGSCEIALRDEYAIDEIVHPCFDIRDNGDRQKIFYVEFLDENGLKRRFEFTAIKNGRFTKNGSIEIGYLNGWIQHGFNDNQPREIVWSTEDPRILNYWRKRLRVEERREAQRIERERREAEEEALQNGKVPAS